VDRERTAGRPTRQVPSGLPCAVVVSWPPRCRRRACCAGHPRGDRSLSFPGWPVTGWTGRPSHGSEHAGAGRRPGGSVQWVGHARQLRTSGTGGIAPAHRVGPLRQVAAVRTCRVGPWLVAVFGVTPLAAKRHSSLKSIAFCDPWVDRCHASGMSGGVRGDQRSRRRAEPLAPPPGLTGACDRAPRRPSRRDGTRQRDRWPGVGAAVGAGPVTSHRITDPVPRSTPRQGIPAAAGRPRRLPVVARCTAHAGRCPQLPATCIARRDAEDQH
jgi:hypothetical protein